MSKNDKESIISFGIIDFKVEDDGKQLFISPATEIAKQKVKQYKGVIMNRVLMPYSLYDGFQKMCSGLVFEITIK